MKTQMRFQKILMLVSLIISALCIVYAISFLTGTYDTRAYLSASHMDDFGFELINSDPYFNAAQSYVDISIVLGIVLLLLVVLNYVMASNSRRNYYITNYVAVIAFAVFALVFAVYGIATLSNVINLYTNEIKWDVYKQLQADEYFHEMFSTIGELPKFSPWFVIGYIVYIIVLLDAAAVALNLVWKIKLMKGEKQLLAQGIAKEAA